MGFLGFNVVTSFKVADTGSMRDVHLLMRTAYSFWENEGAWRSVLESIVDVLKCGVLAVSIFVLGFMVDWDRAMTCATELQCQETRIMHSPSLETVPGAHTLLVMMLFMSASAACLYECKRCVETAYLHFELHDMLCNAIDCGARTPYHFLLGVWFRYRAAADGHEELPLAEETPVLSDLPWNEFLHLFCTVIQKDKSLAIHRQQRFDELRAIQALMVYDNYFIALHQHLLHPEAAHGFGGPAITLIDPSILKFLVHSLFDSSNCLDVTVDQLKVIQEKLLKFLIAYWAFYPFLVSHALVKIVVKNVAAFRARPTEFMERQWTPKAWWTFRLFNEVPHVTNERLLEAQGLANEMLGRVSRPSPIAKFIERMASTIIVVILFLSFLNPPLLMGGVVGHRSLVWWLSTWFIVYTTFRVSDLPLREYIHEKDLTKLSHLLHYERTQWSISGTRWAASIQWDYFHSRLYLLGAALAKTLTMPLILLKLYFDESIPLLVEVIQNNSSRVDGVGSIAVDADFSHSVNAAPHPRPLRATSGEGSDVDGTGPGCGDFKHEKSIASFASVYPHWREHITDDMDDELGLNAFLEALFHDEGGDDDDAEGGDASNKRSAAATATVREGSASLERAPPPPDATTRRRFSAAADGSSLRFAAMQSSRSWAHEMQHLIVSRVDHRCHEVAAASQLSLHRPPMQSAQYGALAEEMAAVEVAPPVQPQQLQSHQQSKKKKPNKSRGRSPSTTTPEGD